MSVSVKVANIAGPIPAIRHEDLMPGYPYQPQHQGIAADPDLPQFPLEGLLPGGWVHDPVFDTRNGPTERAALDLREGTANQFDGVRAERFGHAKRVSS